MADIILLTTQSAPEEASPDPARLLAGEYKTRTFNQWDAKKIWSGIWESTPGKVKVDYTGEWEFCHFIEGEAVLTNEQGQSWRLKAGDGFIIPDGFKGTWETVKAVKKHYVIVAVE
jgi:uncharacterized cupin superfamily protein